MPLHAREKYLEHTISADGLQLSKSKTKAIIDASQPQNVSQLRSFLGMINYYIYIWETFTNLHIDDNCIICSRKDAVEVGPS